MPIFIKTLAIVLSIRSFTPYHKRAIDAEQAGAISWGKQKALHWLKILDERLIGAHNNYPCGVAITLVDYQVAEIISLGDLIRCEYSNFPNVLRWMNSRAACHIGGPSMQWPRILPRHSKNKPSSRSNFPFGLVQQFTPWAASMRNSN